MPILKMELRVAEDGLHGTDPQTGKDVHVGVIRNGVITLLMRAYVDERESCEHCGSLFCLQGDEDDHCEHCGKSHLECDLCDRTDAEICIDCDEPFCESCWTADAHASECTSARPAPGSPSGDAPPAEGSSESSA